MTSTELEQAGLSREEAKAHEAMKGAGCGNCSETGFKGRMAVYEVMKMSDTLREFVLNGASAAEIRDQAVREGMSTLRRSGLNKLLEGVTTLSEVKRISTGES